MTPVLFVLLLSPLNMPPPQLNAPPAPPPKPEHEVLYEAAKKGVEYEKNTVAVLEKAIADYEKALPQLDKKKQLKANIDLARAYLRLGDLQKKKKAKLKSFEAGKAAGDRAIALSKGSSKKLRSKAISWMTFNLAKVGETNGVMNSLFMVGDLKSNLEKALKLNPNNSPARAVLGTIYHALPGLAGGSDKKAMELWRGSVERSPEYGDGWCRIGEYYLEDDEKVKAEVAFQKILDAKKPEYPNDHWKFDKPCARRGLRALKK